MKNPNLLGKQKQIEDLFVEVAAFSGDAQVKAYLTYYLCIRVSGFIEDCIRTILSDYVDANSQNSAKNFIYKKLERIPNPQWDIVMNLVKDFNPTWNNELKNKVDKTYKEAIDSIVKNRNAIAHGGTSPITLRDLENYFRDAQIAIDEFEKICV